MLIDSSTFTVGVQQRSGHWPVVEHHTDSTGLVHRFEYLSADTSTAAAIMASRAVKLAEQLAQGEAESLWADGVWRPLAYNTASELAAKFRSAYQAASGLQAAKMAWWLIERITVGKFTDAQVRGAFGLTTTQYNQMKTRMTTLHDQYAAVVAARGE